eukprot:scaffold279435_cov33-Tisochrysis_lutea.AAC.3
MAFAKDDLWGHVLRRTACRVGSPFHHPGKAEIDELDVAPPVQQNVLRLQVAVCYPQGVKILKRIGDHRRVQKDVALDHPRFIPADERVELTAQAGLKHHVAVMLGLEYLLQSHHEWVVHFGEYARLVPNPVRLLVPRNEPLWQPLERIRPRLAARRLVAYEFNRGKETMAQDAHNLVL